MTCSHIHNRMPATLPRDLEEFWFDGRVDDPAELGSVLILYANEALETCEVFALAG